MLTASNNIWVDQEAFSGLGTALASTDVSAVIESLDGFPIIVERALYRDVAGQVFGAGHAAAGVTAPATEWFLAEGATGPFLDLFVLIANPGDVAADIEATYLLPDGTTIVAPYRVAANSRFNIWVDDEDARLADTAVFTIIRSTNGVPVIVLGGRCQRPGDAPAVAGGVQTRIAPAVHLAVPATFYTQRNGASVQPCCPGPRVPWWPDRSWRRASG